MIIEPMIVGRQTKRFMIHVRMVGEFLTAAVMESGQRHSVRVMSGITVLHGMIKTKEWISR